MKLKVGDKVEHIHFGKGIIKEITCDNCYCVEFYKKSKGLHKCEGICKDKHGWYCNDFDIDLIKSELPKEKSNVEIYELPKFCYGDVEKIIINNPCVVVFIRGGYKGVAKCHSEDNFDARIGHEIAYRRAKVKELKAILKLEEDGLNYYLNPYRKF